MTKMNLKNLKLIAILFLWTGWANAQVSINTTGGDASGNDGTVAYSIGQLFYSTNNSASGTISQGVQQPYEIFSLGIDANKQNISLSIYPNPTADLLQLRLNDNNSGEITYQLFDMKGQLIHSEAVKNNQAYVDMRELPSASYVLHVTNANNLVQSFKILKH